MKLNQEKLLKKMDKLWKNKQCPICGETAWGIDPTIVTPIEVGENKSIQLGGKFRPLITTTCDTCGYTFFINALIADVLDMDEVDNNE